MNEATHGIRRDQAQQPQNEHYNGNGVKHITALSIL
jgi:hypothetical protein